MLTWHQLADVVAWLTGTKTASEEFTVSFDARDTEHGTPVLTPGPLGACFAATALAHRDGPLRHVAIAGSRVGLAPRGENYVALIVDLRHLTVEALEELRRSLGWDSDDEAVAGLAQMEV